MSPGRVDPATEFMSEFALPDFDAFPDRYGWPRENKNGYRIKEQLCGTKRRLRVVAIGAGASGINLAKFLPEQVDNLSLTIYDKDSDIGGTWLENVYVLSAVFEFKWIIKRRTFLLYEGPELTYENRYPGVACDIPSVNYQVLWDRWTR